MGVSQKMDCPTVRTVRIEYINIRNNDLIPYKATTYVIIISTTPAMSTPKKTTNSIEFIPSKAPKVLLSPPLPMMTIALSSHRGGKKIPGSSTKINRFSLESGWKSQESGRQRAAARTTAWLSD